MAGTTGQGWFDYGSYTAARARGSIRAPWERDWTVAGDWRRFEADTTLPLLPPLPPQPRRFGGVVVGPHGHVLLRKAANGHGGYGWTFPKGGAKKGESDSAAARREVREEAGWDARIVARVRGRFRTPLSTTVYFLMEPVDEVPGGFGWESEGVAWVTPALARQLIGQTANAAGRERDLAVLKAGLAAWRKLRAKGG